MKSDAKIAVLAKLAEGSSVTAAARAVGLNRRTIQRAAARDRSFAGALALARAAAIARRAVAA